MKVKNPVHSIESLARLMGGRYTGEGSLKIRGVAPLDTAVEGQITFVTNTKYAVAAGKTKASAILSDREIPGVSKPFLMCKNPYAVLARLIALFNPPSALKKGIHPGAKVQKGAKVHRTAVVMPQVTVLKGAVIGAGTILYPGVFVGEGVSIGADCLLYPNCVIREGCVLGDRVILQPACVIGSDGFGFARDGEGYLKIPQVGNVVIEDDVEIGSCTCVDRAVLGTTRIGKGTKLDNLIQISHNVTVGRHGVIAAQSGIAGSTTVGDHIIMGGQVGVAGHLKVGDKVTLATRTGVMEDLVGDQVYWGAPSNQMHAEMKSVAAYRDLPQMLKRIRRMEKRLEKIFPEGKD